jgi:FkbM family methyltransferase
MHYHYEVSIREFIGKFIAMTGYRLIAIENYNALSRDPRYRAGKNWSHRKVPGELRDFVFSNLQYSNSQIQQDLLASWVTYKLRTGKFKALKEPKYFVEFGATNGFQLSNTFFLEKFENWKGLLAEPAKVWHIELLSVRNCEIDLRCVFSESGETLMFTETSDPELGTLSRYSDWDNHAEERQGGRNYEVETVSLYDLLSEHQSPSYIDYLSIDTEGSEFEILRVFDFERYSFGLISVEHNFTASRHELNQILTGAGYHRVLDEVSGQDDWYVSREAISFFQ